MGTDKIRNLQCEINELIRTLGWSQKRLGREIYASLHDDDDEIEIRRMEEKVKKALSRPSTKHELLEQYRTVIANHPEFIKSQQVIPCYTPMGELEPKLEQEMKAISKSITQLIKSSNSQ
jgi:hypothetical protein